MAQFNPNIEFIVNGESVSAPVTNRPISQNKANIDWLYSQLEQSSSRSALFLQNQPMETDLRVGQPVFFNVTTQRFEKALAAISASPLEGDAVFNPDDRAYCWGVVYEAFGNVGTVLVHGSVEMSLTDAFSADEPAVAPGLYHLSGVEAGRLTKQQPAASIPVLFVQEVTDATSQRCKVFVTAKFDDILTGHRHYKVPLVAAPAGDYVPNASTMTNPDATLSGWLPANHAVFEGKTPAGAFFGYNIQVSGLASSWPPVSPSLSSLMWQRDADLQSDPVMAEVPKKFYRIDANGLWWMTGDLDLLPWSKNRQYSKGEDVSAPSKWPQTFQFWFTKADWSLNSSVVTSLRAAPGSGVVITSWPGGEEASAGDVTIDFNLSGITQDMSTPGYQVVKEFAGNVAYRGPVVESVSISGNALSIASDLTVEGKNYGNVKITANNPLQGLEFALSTSHLEGTREYFDDGVIGILFRSDFATSVTSRIFIPVQPVLPVDTTAAIDMTFLVPATGNVPENAFALEYRVVSESDSLNTPFPASSPWTAIAANFSAALPDTLTFPAAYRVVSDPIPVKSGDIVYVRLVRNTPVGNYKSEMVLIRSVLALQSN